jgi:hypothetical protein
MRKMFQKEVGAQVALILFLGFTIFWGILQLGVFDGVMIANHSVHKIFGALYGLVALWGAIWGVTIAKKWGGMTSLIGRAIILFSIGLFLQEFGQVSLSVIDFVFNIQGAYPSIGDVGFFGSIPFYLIGVMFLAKASGVKIGLKSVQGKLQVVAVLVIPMTIGYLLFLNGYVFDLSSPVKVLLDLGYPIFQALYVSSALITLLLSRGVLGGIMRTKILVVLIALFIQFISDYTFLYQSSRGIWSVGGVNDYMYLLAYFVMTLGLFQFKTAYDELKKR